MAIKTLNLPGPDGGGTLIYAHLNAAYAEQGTV
jgi:hypothetical protein